MKEADHFLSVHIVIALFDVHRDEVEGRLTHLLPLLLEFFILLHDIVVVEDSKPKLVLEHLRLQVLEHHVGQA